jgi:hypothetical protein
MAEKFGRAGVTPFGSTNRLIAVEGVAGSASVAR